MLRAAWLINVENILGLYGFPRAQLLFECGKADLETAAKFLQLHGLVFWSNVFIQYSKLRGKCFIQERKWALKEKKLERVFKLMRAYTLFGRKRMGGDGSESGMENWAGSLSCRNKTVQILMEKGYRRLGHILPTEQGRKRIG